MKATGIVRRIDDLGRVVIPKEIRRTMRIREGDPLEIFTDAEGAVLFKKYSPVGELAPQAAQYAEVLSKATGLGVLVSDRDHIVAAAGLPRREALDKRVSAGLDEVMQSRRTHLARAGDTAHLQPIDGVARYAGVAAPIIAAGDVSGAVCLLLPENGAVPSDGEQKLAQVAAGFLGRQLEC